MKYLAPALAVLLLSPSSTSGDAPILQVSFDTATVSVAPDTVAKRQLFLPGLEYTFTAEVNCREPSKPKRLSISIADTRVLLEIAEDGQSSNIKQALQVPATQLGPLQTDGFCIEGNSETQTAIVVQGVLTSSASVRCASDNDESIHFASEPLAVRIECAMDDDYVVSSTER